MQTIPAHGGDRAAWAERTGRNDFLDFSANINPLGMPEEVREALEKSGAQSEHYPDTRCRMLRRALAGFEAVPEEWILCGNGAADLIYRITCALKPGRALLPAPTFSEYERALLQAGCGVDFYELGKETRFQIRPDFLSRICGTQIVFLCNPNNPSGGLTPRKQLEEILWECGRTSTVLVVDECFLEFVKDGEAGSLKDLLDSSPNLIILRAFTKIFAMPGIRLGYCLCSDAKLLERIGEAGPPWNVSVPAQLCGIAATRQRDFITKSRILISEERSRLQERLQGFGFTVYESAANYILFHTDYEDLALKLALKGILLRDCGNFRGLGPGYFRTAVRTGEENNALLTAISRLLL